MARTPPAGRDSAAVVSAREPKRPAGGFGQAMGTRQNPGPLRRTEIKFPPKIARTEEENDLLYNFLSDYATAGLYGVLEAFADFEDGSVPATTIKNLMTIGTPPKAQQGPSRRGPSYEQIRRMLNELESVGLIVRDRVGNALQGQLRMRLPYKAAAFEEWKKKQSAQRKSQQELAQGQKARKPA